MKYIDRKGNITIEENRQDKFLRHLYNDWGGRLCLKIIIQPFVTRLGGWFLNTRLSARMIPGFVERNHIDLSSCTRQEFASYNDFFTSQAPGFRLVIFPTIIAPTSIIAMVPNCSVFNRQYSLVFS